MRFVRLQHWWQNMRIGLPASFFLLILAQAAHSAEEYAGGLWNRLAPARAVSRLFSADLSTGFVIANTLIIGLGLLCYLGPVRRSWRSAVSVAWIWVVLELGNGMGHIGLAMAAGAYVPGVYTAPLLLGCSGLVAYRLLEAGAGESPR